MISEKLQKAREYEKKNYIKADYERPLFHATGGIGWINDPNGFSVYKNEYHLFHQYHPYSLEWGPMHWGHLKTKDFIKWERLPVALAPDCDYDKDGCYSGTAIETPDGKHLIIYTGVSKIKNDSDVICEYQQQCIAIGDGVNYEKYETNPVIRWDMLPEGAYINDFRDPKIWLEDGKYYTAVACRIKDGSGAILLYESDDAFNWKYVSTMAECQFEYGTMWECPDFFKLDNKKVMIISPCEVEAKDLEFHNGHNVMAFIGDFDKCTGKFIRERVQAIDYGLDFYAPETIEATDGRRIMIGWMRNWANTRYNMNKHIFGAMTLPRELEIVNGRVVQRPVRELENYRINKLSYTDISINGQIKMDELRGRSFDMTIDLMPEKSLREFTIILGQDEKHDAKIIYNVEESTIIIDRKNSGGAYDIVHERKFLIYSNKEILRFRIIMDKDSVELFVNNGEQTATFILYSAIAADGIAFSSKGKATINIEKYDIQI